MAAKADRVLLPTDVVPVKYSISLTPDLKNFTFEGKEDIDVEVKNAVNTITVHSLDIKILLVEFRTGSEVIKTTKIEFQQKDEMVTFTFEKNLPTGKAVLHIEYQGNHNDQMVGFYRSKYVVNNETRYMVTTQMEPASARRAFPSWDEPAVKAVFEISLTVPSHMTALSNMEPVLQKQAGSNLKTVKFAPTPIMSTYLVAFIVGEFDFVAGTTKEGITVRVFTPLGKNETGLFSLDVAIRCLSYYNEYYGIPYPLSKLDMVAIADFSAGAMENWGLVTYRETALLIDPKTSGIDSKQRVAYVVAHELAHQWFGNLVTMEWWKELWLNEGFATFVGNQAVDYLFPEWDIWTQFVSHYVNRALELDGLENSHPIEVEVKTSAEIEEIFDQISYAKGASVIRMLSDLVGEAHFRKGLNIYLNRFKYRNAVTEDLWQALSEASGFDISTFMNAYTKRTGYPLVSIESTGKPNEFKTSQSRFYASGKQSSDAADQWWISIPIRTSDNKTVTRVDLKNKDATLTFPVAGETQWFKANANQSGFFRVKYSADVLSKLVPAISSLSLPTVDRIGVQNDAFALAKAGIIPTVQALSIAKAYSNEVDYTVWSDLAANLGAMSTVWSNEPNKADIKSFIRNLFKPIGKKLGWTPQPGESALDTMLRVVVLNQLGNNDDQETIEEARKRFNDYVSKKTDLPPDLRFLCYKLAVAYGGQAEYDTVLNIYRTAEMHEEKIRALRALGYKQDPQVLQKTLEFILSDEVRAQDIFLGMYTCTADRIGRDATWEFFKARWSDIHRRLGDSAMLLDRLIKYVTIDFTGEDKAQDIERYFEGNPVPAAARTIKQSLETIRAHTKWVESNREAVATFLKSNI